MHIIVGGKGGLKAEFIYQDEVDGKKSPIVEHGKSRALKVMAEA